MAHCGFPRLQTYDTFGFFKNRWSVQMVLYTLFSPGYLA